MSGQVIKSLSPRERDGAKRQGEGSHAERFPLRDKAGLARAESWDASLLSLPEYQCRPHGWAYISRGHTAMRITKEVDPYSREIVAYHPEWHQSTDMPVYLDGRGDPPEKAAHTWGGFSTGKWEGDILRIE